MFPVHPGIPFHFNLQKEQWQWVALYIIIGLFIITFKMFIVLASRLEKVCTGNQSVKYTHLDLTSNVDWKRSELSLPEIQMMISKQDKKGEIKKKY